MLKYLNPEFALGFLVATIFGAAVLGWQSSYAPTEIEKQECRESAKKAGHKTDECKSLWEKTTTDPVAFFTFVLSASTIGLWAATGIGILIQTRDTRILQRAYVGVKPLAIEFWDGDKNQVIAHLAIENFGNLPAENVRNEVRIKWHQNRELEFFEPLRMSYPGIVLLPHIPAERGTDRLPAEHAAEFNKGNGYIYVYGRIEYEDGFGRGRWLHFGHRYPCKEPKRIRYHYRHNEAGSL
jgi:hypothetical protein